MDFYTDFKSTIISIASLIKTDAHAIEYREILELIEPLDLLSETEIEEINELVELNMDWQNKYYGTIESWLNGEDPTDSTDPTESTTTDGSARITETTATAIVVAFATVTFFI